MIIIGDIHLRIYSDNIEADIFNSINFILEYAKENKERNIFILGDISDTKSVLSVKPFIEFYNILKNNKDISFYILSGNHDIVGYNKENKYISTVELLKDISNVRVIVEPTILDIENYRCLILPFDKEENIRNFLNIDADICLGHIGISEAVLSSGISIVTPFKAEDFKKYKLVFFGHYHKPQSLDTEYNSIIYVGSIVPLRRDEIYDEKRFIVLKPNLEYESIPITCYKKYYEIVIDNNGYSEKEIINKIKKLSSDYKVIVKFLVPLDKSLLSSINKLNVDVIDLSERQSISRGIFSNMSLEEQMHKYLDYMCVREDLRELYIREGIKVIKEETNE